jgi:hypothetical protein
MELISETTRIKANLVISPSLVADKNQFQKIALYISITKKTIADQAIITSFQLPWIRDREIHLNQKAIQANEQSTRRSETA